MTNPYDAPAAQVQEAMQQCKGCGQEIHSQAASCPHCGLPQRARGYKSKGMAGALALLIGGFGVHRFYLGQWWGIFYLLFFWTFIPGLISIVEAIVMWCTDTANWDFKHNEGNPAAPHEQAGGGTIVVVILAIFIGGIMFTGILASVSLPAYADYKVREQVGLAISEIAAVRAQYKQYYEVNQSLPSGAAALGLQGSISLPSGHQLQISEDALVILFVDERPTLKNKTVEFKLYETEYGTEWDCTGGDIEVHHRPSMCRSDR